MLDLEAWTDVIAVKKVKGISLERKSGWESFGSFEEGKREARVAWDSSFSF